MSEINEILNTTAQISGLPALNESHNNESGLDPGTEFDEPNIGRNSQHGTMALILLGALLGFQLVILYWKQRHYRSFQLVTLVGLWLIPMYIFGIQAHFWRFMTIWVLYSIVNSCILYLASRKPLDHKTPRLVYKWFSIVYKVSYAVGITGYSIIMFTFFGIIQLFYTGPEVIELGVLLLCYGLYFGVLSRDFVEICTDRMASTLGYYNKDGFPRKHLRANICAICGVAANGTNEAGEQQNVFQLACRHVFHNDCIRGWCLIGKKDICPYCKEKVDMKEFKTNPWDTQQQLYLSLLDGVRYLIVWQPVIFAFVELAYHLIGLE
ncbi:RING finger protein [Gigaspora margarita]|uniref:RING finger protein n=1 Tax=Gigaspora margarita TaxID=4874 RepID=A0A8H4AP18_GIGMA|nr:RING finger protein [Gigaspora margarita]